MYQSVYPRASHYAVSYCPSPRQMKQKLLILVLQSRAVIPGEDDLFPTLHDNMVKIKRFYVFHIHEKASLRPHKRVPVQELGQRVQGGIGLKAVFLRMDCADLVKHFNINNSEGRLPGSENRYHHPRIPQYSDS